MLLLCPLLVEVEVELRLLVRLLRNALDRRKVLPGCSRRTHAEAIVAHGQMCVHFLNWVHLPSTHVFGRDSPRFVHEGYLVVDALRDKVCVALTGGVEKVELLSPIAFAL
jgi:hypothetical protein